MKLREYIEKVKDLEISLYKQNLLKSDIEQLIELLKHPQLKRETNYRNSDSGTDDITPMAVGCMIPGAIVGFFVGIWFIGSVVSGVIGGAVIGIIAGIAITVTKNGSHKSDINKINREIAHENEKIRKQNEETLKLSPKQQKILENELCNINEKIIDTEKVLNAYYSKGIVFEKYRSLVPICMFYEYLCSGRCDSLEGHEGAYNIYESELRMNVIIGKLDEIIDRLDKIEQNQYVIAQAISKTNEHLGRIENSIGNCINRLERLENSVELNTYYSEITAINTSYIARIKSLN